MTNDFIPASEMILNDDGSIYHLCLKPGEVARNIITVGDPERVDEVAKHFTQIELKKENREFKTVTGYFGNKRLSVISTGIGTDNVDIVLNEIDALFQIDFKTRRLKQELTKLNFIRIGTSGALQEDIPIDSFIVSRAALAFDRLLPFYSSANFPFVDGWPSHLNQITPQVIYGSKRLIQLAPKNMLNGITATMPGFYAPQGRSFRLAAALSQDLIELRALEIGGHRITNMEMETSGIYGLAHLLGHEAISFNAILANRITGEFSKKGHQTVERLILNVLDWLVNLED